MEHPQPAVDFLTSIDDELGIEAPEIPFGEWYAYESIDAEHEDDIRDYPVVWDTKLELPTELQELSTEDYVAIRPFKDTINLNAAAIGLGLEDAEYVPKQFSGLVYRLENGVAVIIYGGYLCLSIGESKQECIDGIQELLDSLKQIGLRDEITFTSEPIARSVGDFMQSWASTQ